MAIKTNTIYFYQLELNKFLNYMKEDGTPATETVDISIFKSEFFNILNEKLNDYNVMSFADGYSLEIMNYGKIIGDAGHQIQGKINSIDMNTSWIFGKIGTKQEIINIHLRDIRTLEPEEIEKQINQFFECFSYFYMFFEKRNNCDKCTIAFLKPQASPNIRKLELLSSMLSNIDYKISINAIISKNAFETIISKDIINSLKYKVSLPSKAVISEIFRPTFFNSHDNDFFQYVDAESIELEIVLKGARSKNMIKDKNILKDVIDKLKKYTVDNDGKEADYKAKAKNEDEKMLEYDFLDNKLISKASFNIDTIENWEDEIRRTMMVHYKENRNKLLESLR